MSNARVVQIVGGSHDGAEYAVPPGQSDLRLTRIAASVLPQMHAPDMTTDPFDVPYTVEVYGPATEADRLLGRWSMLGGGDD